MPSRYIIREFAENEYYHIFNRGFEKNKIFKDEQDFKIFLYYLFIYLAKPETIAKTYPLLSPRLQTRNLNHDLELLSFCLMDNHFHFLLKQTSKNGISKFMQQLTNAYTKYFNGKYQRTGNLLQGRFKAVRISSDELLIHISRYIHLNPVVAGIAKTPEEYRWSSYKEYASGIFSDIVRGKTLLAYFKSAKEYKNFTEDQITYAKELDKIKHLAID